MSKEQRKMMDEPNKLITEAGDPLTKLFRLILRELGVDAPQWNRRLTKFLSSHLSRVPKNAKDIGQERNNFNRAIAKRHITFKTFQKAVQILGPIRYSMSITMEMRDGRTIEIATDMGKNPYAKLDDLSAVWTGEGITPEHDNVDYHDEDDDITGESVEQTIQEIQVHQADSGASDPQFTAPRMKKTKREQRDLVVNRILQKPFGDEQ